MIFLCRHSADSKRSLFGRSAGFYCHNDATEVQCADDGCPASSKPFFLPAFQLSSSQTAVFLSANDVYALCSPRVRLSTQYLSKISNDLPLGF
jgi:hypothetical protein